MQPLFVHAMCFSPKAKGFKITPRVLDNLMRRCPIDNIYLFIGALFTVPFNNPALKIPDFIKIPYSPFLSLVPKELYRDSKITCFAK